MRKQWARIVFGVVLTAFAIGITSIDTGMNEWGRLGVFLIAYFAAGGDVLLEAISNVFRGKLWTKIS